MLHVESVRKQPARRVRTLSRNQQCGAVQQIFCVCEMLGTDKDHSTQQALKAAHHAARRAFRSTIQSWPCGCCWTASHIQRRQRWAEFWTISSSVANSEVMKWPLTFFLSTRAFRFLARGDSNESYAWLIMRSFRKPRCCYTHRKRQQVLIRTFGCAAFDPNAALRTGEGCCM